jgi:hypothetical protein
MCGDSVDERAASIFSGTDLSTRVCFPYCRAISSCMYLISSRCRWSRYVLSTPRIKSVYLSTVCANPEDYRFSNPCRERLRTYIYWPTEQPLASLKGLRFSELVHYMCTGWCRITFYWTQHVKKRVYLFKTFFFGQQMQSLLKHKMLQLTVKISLYMAATCFGPFGPSSGNIRRNLAEVTVFVELLVKIHR